MCKVTPQFIADSFSKFNWEYFDNNLLCPHLRLCAQRQYWVNVHVSGYGLPNGGETPYAFRIHISNMHNRADTDYKNTILHEMIHLYIHQNNINDTNRYHGKVLYFITDRINSQGSWNIKRADSVVGCGLLDNLNVKPF